MYTCPKCGDDRGSLDVQYDYDALRARFTKESLASNSDLSIARWMPLLPLSGLLPMPPLSVGRTPMYLSQTLAEMVGVREVRVKDDGRNPTGSLKDRASAVCLVHAMEHKEPLVAAASTGNAASSLAGLAASVGMTTVIFLPKNAPEAKVVQLLVYGARVVMVDGTYDDAFDLCLQATREFGWYSRNTGFNPYCVEGKKTAALEMAEQYQWDVPDRVFVSMGDGCILAGLYKGFYDLKQLGFIDRIPKLMGVQAEGSAAISRAFRNRGKPEIHNAKTVADSICVNKPRAALQALRALRESSGGTVVVSDKKILESMLVLARTTGVFAEPAGAAAVAGLLAMSGGLAADERVAVLVTGNGLKDIASAQKAADSEPLLLQPDPYSLRSYCEKLQHDLQSA